MAAAKPLVLISSSRTAYLGEPAIRLCENYTEAIAAAGGLPVAAPLVEDPSIYDNLLDRADGLLLSGGSDLSPGLYREALLDGNPEKQQTGAAVGESLIVEPDSARDRIELHMLRGAEQRGLPVLGICRGAQLMNVAHGGTLYHDIAAQHTAPAETSPIQHNEHMDGRVAHDIEVVPGSLLARVTGAERLAVNSLHHQAIRTPARHFDICAKATDGIVEAIECREGPFMLGVQWHPEYLHCEPAMSRIFRAFVEAAAR